METKIKNKSDSFFWTFFECIHPRRSGLTTINLLPLGPVLLSTHRQIGDRHRLGLVD